MRCRIEPFLRSSAAPRGAVVPVAGDGGPVAALEVIPEALGPGEQADADTLTPYRHVADPIAEQRADVVFTTPQWRWLRARRGRRDVRFHGREHLAGEAFRSP